MAYLANEGIFEGYTTVSAKRIVPVGYLRGILGTIRNRILMFALEIEGENPDAGEAPIGSDPIAQPVVTQHFNTTILGGTNTLAIAGRDVQQTITNIAVGDWDSLQEALRVVGLEDRDIGDLKAALDADTSDGETPLTEIGEKTQGWLGKIMTKVRTGSLVLASGLTVEVLVDLIMKYLGLTG